MFLLAPLALAACTANVVGGGGAVDRGDPTDPGGSGGAGGGGSGTGTSAVAMTRAQADAEWAMQGLGSGSGTTTTGAGGGPAFAPDDLFLHVSDLGASCASPSTQLTCGGHWDLRVVLPTAYQKVGTYDLTDPAIQLDSFFSMMGPLQSSTPGDCGFGGGTVLGGTIDIVAIDASHVEFVVTMPSDPVTGVSPSGTYTAPRCP